MIRLLKNIYTTHIFYICITGIIILFVLGYVFPFVFIIAKAILFIWIGFLFIDIFQLFRKKEILIASRLCSNKLSLGDENKITIEIINSTKSNYELTLIDELPFQFQNRNFSIKKSILPQEKIFVDYSLTPVSRGEYNFGNLLIFIESRLHLVQRKFTFDIPFNSKVYPSIIQMKKFEMSNLHSLSITTGLRRIRRIGHSYEFENIKNFVNGDDFRSINWKATGKRFTIMANQYEDEKHQNIYVIIDKSRSMQISFNGMTLLDYAINSSLALLNIVLKKYDNAGLITFSKKINCIVKANNKNNQLQSILEHLYNEQPGEFEANYELLYDSLKANIKNRSLLMLFTNFESYDSLKRIIPILKKINHSHLLVVNFFENVELNNYILEDTKTVEEIYLKTIAEKFKFEKQRILSELTKQNIQVVISKPNDLSLNSINKYLELKARGLI